ncbi:MAG: RluA family pseudouridine synthase [Chlorobi bacterium]|nr:RluA family pseudouridine synthase [Chlorobiota bacterium]
MSEENLNNTEEPLEDNELYEHYRFNVDPGQTLLRIDKYLVNRIQNASRNKIQAAAAAGSILVNGKPVKSNYKVKPNDDISIVMSYPPADNEIIPEDIPLNIVYEDDSVLVINKEQEMVIHPGYGNKTGTLVNALVYHFKGDPYFNPENERPGIVHRIDKGTSGLLVIAKTEIARNHLARQFFEKTTERTYWALVWGQPKDDEGTIIGNIGRHPNDRMQMLVFPEDSDKGKHAVTHYRVLERLGYVTLVECRLETGRTHQIRAHFKHIGHPLFNDERYGGDKILKGTTFTKYKQFVQNCFKIMPRQALHAKTLGFIHPETGKKMTFDSELPEDMATVLDKWRNYIAGRKE